MANKKSNKLLLIVFVSLLVSASNYLCYPFINRLLTNEVTVVVANKQLSSGELITSADVDYISVNPAEISGEIFTDESDVIGKTVCSDNTIYKGSYFYKKSITNKDLLETPKYYFEVEIHDGYKTLVEEDDYVDIYLQADDFKDTSTKIMGMLVENCKVKSLKDKLLIVELDIDELDYCLRASNIGKLIVVANTIASNNLYNNYFSIERTRNFIDNYSLTYRFS